MGVFLSDAAKALVLPIYTVFHVEILKINYHNTYYISHNSRNKTDFDFDVAETLLLECREYRNILKNQFNGFLMNNDTHFRSVEDCAEAIKYLEEVYLPISKLLGEL